MNQLGGDAVRSLACGRNGGGAEGELRMESRRSNPTGVGPKALREENAPEQSDQA